MKPRPTASNAQMLSKPAASMFRAASASVSPVKGRPSSRALGRDIPSCMTGLAIRRRSLAPGQGAPEEPAGVGAGVLALSQHDLAIDDRGEEAGRFLAQAPRARGQVV